MIVTCVLEFAPPPFGFTVKSVSAPKFGFAGFSEPLIWIWNGDRLANERGVAPNSRLRREWLRLSLASSCCRESE